MRSFTSRRAPARRRAADHLWNGGQKWASSAVTTQRIQNLPTASRFNRIAVPRTGQPTTDSNTIALGGLSGGGTDGILELGVANRV
jgi:hypothetical protein